MKDIFGDADEVIGHCEIHGEYKSMVYGFMKSKAPTCAECYQIKIEAERKAEQVESQKKHASARLDARLNNINAPYRLMIKKYSDYKPANGNARKCFDACKEFGDNWLAHYERGSNLILCGKPGTGKTHLATVLCKQIVHQHDKHQPLYTTASEMLRYVRASYGKSCDYTEHDAIQKFANAHLLVLDEVGVKLPSEHDRATLFEIIDKRYQEMLPTVLISNLTIDEISEQTDGRMVDRLSENGTLMDFTWDSYRSIA